MTFSEQFRKINKHKRNKLNISQKELAEEVGVSLKTFNSWECGRQIPTTWELLDDWVSALNKKNDGN